jgi:hypothetical protein
VKANFIANANANANANVAESGADHTAALWAKVCH